jgi:hypothetical protein
MPKIKNAIGTDDIGPTFGNELVDAGLGGLPFTWTQHGGLNYGPTITSEQRIAIEAVYEAHNPQKSHLVRHANETQWKLATGGYTVTVGGTPREFDTDQVSYSLLTAKMIEAKDADGPFTIYWQFGPTEIVQVGSDEFIVAVRKIAVFVQTTFDTLALAIADINAGTITTDAQIDALFGNIPIEG